VGRLTQILTRILENLVVGLFGVLCCLVFGEVVSRYAFGQPHSWSEELIIYLFTWVSFLGAALAFRNGRHVSVSFFVGGRSPRAQAAWECAVNLIVLAFVALLFVQAVRFVRMNDTVSSIVLQIPLSWVSACLLVMTALMVLYTLGGLGRAIHRLSEPRPPAEASRDAAAERVV